MQGNIAYASESRLKKRSITRRDEIESMLYILIHCYTGIIPGEPYRDHANFIQIKLCRTLTQWIDFSGCNFLNEIGLTVQSTDPEEVPNYSEMRFMLIKNLLCLNIAPCRFMKFSP